MNSIQLGLRRARAVQRLQIVRKLRVGSLMVEVKKKLESNDSIKGEFRRSLDSVGSYQSCSQPNARYFYEVRSLNERLMTFGMKVRDGLNKSIQKSEFLQVRENQLVRINKLAEKVIEKGSCDELNALGAIQRLRDSIDLEFSESVEFSQDRTISNLAMTCEAVATYSSYQNGMESLAEVNDRALVGVMTFVDSHITKMDRDDYWANESHQRCDEPERKELDDLDLCDGKRRDWDNRDDVVVTTELPQKGTFVEISHNQDQGVKVKLVGKEGCNTELLNQSCSELRKVFTDERVRFSAVELVKPRCA